MPTDQLSVFAGGSQSQVLPGPSMSINQPGVPGKEKKPIQVLAEKMQVSLATIQAEEEAARKENKLAAAKALDFPYQVIVEESPQDKIRLSNGVNTYLTVTVDPVYQRLEFSKYAFTPEDSMKLITRILTDAGYDMDPKSPKCLKIGDYIRPSGF